MAIRRNPAGFEVVEILSPDLPIRPPGAAPLPLYRLLKRGLTTPEAVERIARALRVPIGAVAMGGLKDKYATTTQHITIDPTGKQGNRWARESSLDEYADTETASISASPDEVPREVRGIVQRRRDERQRGARPASPAAIPYGVKGFPHKVGGRNWEMELLGFVERPMSGQCIAANRFTILLGDLAMHDCRVMDGAAKMLQDGQGRLMFMNYFGSQRFGTIRHGRGFLAKSLMRGDFEQALRLAIATPARADRPVEKAFKHILAECWGQWGKALRKLPMLPYRRAVEVLCTSDFRAAFAALPYFLQQINVEAYQSFLWNATASTLIRQRCRKERMWEVRDPLRLMRFVAYDATDEELREMILPLLSPTSKLEGPWAAAAQAVLKSEHISLADLRIPGMARPFFGSAPRHLMVEARDFFLTRPDRDERDRHRFQRRVVFELPRGAYATVLLAALGQ